MNLPQNFKIRKIFVEMATFLGTEGWKGQEKDGRKERGRTTHRQASRTTHNGD